jgi:hypothetical protein
MYTLQEAQCRLEQGLVLPAHDYVLKCSHTFNILDARRDRCDERQAFRQMRDRPAAYRAYGTASKLEFARISQRGRSQYTSGGEGAYDWQLGIHGDAET